ncbi:MAG: glycine betaine ABC transporter substrate-binding protein [Castellaniella sp.]
MKLTHLLPAITLALATSVAHADTVVVGGKNFTEQQIMAEMTSQLLQAKGYDVDMRAGMGSVVLRQAQENGQIDVCWEYTGTALITYNKISEPMGPDETYATVKKLDAEKGLVWLNASSANNTYALGMRRTDAEERGIASISDLAAAVNSGSTFSLASTPEFAARPDGLKPLEVTYGFAFGRPNVRRMDAGLTYQALRDGQVDVSVVFSTDGRIPAFDFVVLEDDKQFFPAYALTPVIRKAVLDSKPELADLLNAVSAKLDDQTMAALNASVDVDKISIRDAARGFLKDQGLI